MTSPASETLLATVGIVGAGSISDVYYAAIARSPILALKSCASRGMESARRQASRYGGDAVSVDEMLADPAIDLIVNLAPAAAHFELNRRILEAGKHVYTEKPFTLTAADARILADLARAKALRIGSAPDTFFGGGHQEARALIDGGMIGRPVTGTAFVGIAGIESFHPNPAPFYRPGGEPIFDIGPYYITQLVNLLGPVARVVAHAAWGRKVRTITSQPRAGETFRSEIPTTFHAILIFEGGASVQLTTSLDVWRHERRPMEIHGEEGSVALPDPNFFAGDPLLSVRGEPWRVIDISDRALSAPTRTGWNGQPIADYRGVGLVDMVLALRDGRKHRTDIDLVLHVVEVMEAIGIAGVEGDGVSIKSRCARPAPFDRTADAEAVSAMG